MNLPPCANGVKSHFLTLVALSLAVSLSALSAEKDSSPESPGRRAGPASIPAPDEETPPVVVINEIMADPTPVVGLPDAEWIELCNPGLQPVSLNGWELKVGSYRRILPDTLLPPGHYLIICAQAAAASLSLTSRVVALSSFPALRNSGTSLILLLPNGIIADQINFSDGWYGDATKKKGGWSLERKDPLRRCGQRANWCASSDPAGGTPGRANSVMAANPDLIPPSISTVNTLSPLSAEVLFSEPMDSLLLKAASNYHFTEERGPLQVTLHDDSDGVTLVWTRPLAPNHPCEMILSNISDECGHLLVHNKAEIVWVLLQPGDVILHEILFNPFSGGNDFIELLNLSEKKIPSSLLVLATRDPDGQLRKPVFLGEAAFTLGPGEIMAVTTDTAGVLPYYPSAHPSHLREVTSLPAMYNEQGNIVLLTDSLVLLEEMSYHENMHHPLLASHEGVSLERSLPRLPAGSPGNWHSAAESAGFATPGAPNSAAEPTAPSGTAVSFQQTAFSPDNDGFLDELIMVCTTDFPGWLAECLVFDLSGQPRVTLARNLLLGTTSRITWNGKDETGSRLPAGPYVVSVELFHPGGQRITRKCAVFLTARGDL